MAQELGNQEKKISTPSTVESHKKMLLSELKEHFSISPWVEANLLPKVVEAYFKGDEALAKHIIESKVALDSKDSNKKGVYVFTHDTADNLTSSIKKYMENHREEIIHTKEEVKKTVISEEVRQKLYSAGFPKKEVDEMTEGDVSAALELIAGTSAQIVPKEVPAKEENEGGGTKGSGKGDGEAFSEDNSESKKIPGLRKRKFQQRGLEEKKEDYDPSNRLTTYFEKKERKNKKRSEKTEKEAINKIFSAAAKASGNREEKKIFEKRVGFGTVTEKMKDIPALAPSLEDLEKRQVLLEKDMGNESPEAKKILKKELADLKKEIAEVSLIKELFQSQIPQIVLHGNKGSYEDLTTKEKKQGFKPITDIDGLTSMSLINLAGIEYKLVHFVQKGEHEEGALNIDTGGVDGAKAVKAGKIPAGVQAIGVIEIEGKRYTLNIDNHGEGRGGKPSSAFSTYEILRRTDLLTEEKIKNAGWTRENLEQMIQSVNELDSLSYSITPEKFKTEWARTFLGIAKSIPARIPMSFIEEMFKKGISPKEVMYNQYSTPKADASLGKEEREKEQERLSKEVQAKQQTEVRRFVEAVLGVGTTDKDREKIETLTKNIYETSQQTQKLVYLSEQGTSKNLEEMEKLGILKYTKELKRVLIDFIREKKSGNVSGKIPLGVIAAYGQGYDTWISWNEKENSLFISKFKGDISEIHAKIKKLFPHVEATIRGAMIVVSPSKRDPNAPMVTTEQLIEALGLKKEVSKEGGGNTALEKEFAEVSVKIKTLDMEIHKIDESIGEENKEIARIQARLDEITEERKKFGKEIESRKPQSIDIEGLREEINTILLKELRAEGGKLTKAPKVVLIENGYNISAQAMVTKFFQNITIDMYIELRNKNEGIDVVYKINADKYEDRVKDKIGPSFNQLVPKMKEYFSNKYKKEVDTMKIVNGNLVLQFK